MTPSSVVSIFTVLALACGTLHANGQTIPLPMLAPPARGQPVLADAGGQAWDAGGQPLIPDPTSLLPPSITLRNGTLQGALLRVPVANSPLALVSGPSFSGRWFLEHLVVATTCAELELLSGLACDIGAAWITADGQSVTIRAFTPPAPLAGTFTLLNVTITCDRTAAPGPTTSAPACVTASATTQDQLLALMSYNGPRWTQLTGGSLPYLSPQRLHVALAANISLDAAEWAAAPPILTRPSTTLSGDCLPGRVTALDLSGGVALLPLRGGAKLRLLCLELSNLATNTASMPRGLVSGGIWAADVDVPSGARLHVDNCTMVVSQDEYLWQSYYMAQVLAATAVSTSVSVVLPTYQGSMTSTELRWHSVISPRVVWRDTVFTIVPTVFPATVPSSFVLKYLGLSLYLTHLRMVRNCSELLAAVLGASAAQPAVVLTANVSLAPCWPAGGVEVPPLSSLQLLGLPDRAISLDLAGRADAFHLAQPTVLSVRYLTLTGLSIYNGVGLATSPPAAPSLSPVSGSSLSSPPSLFPSTSPAPAHMHTVALGLATAMLWSFHFTRVATQLQLEHVKLAAPGLELQQYDSIRAGASVLPYFEPLILYFRQATAMPTEDGTLGTTAAAASLQPPLSFQLLLLPGIRANNVTLMTQPGAYPGWSAAMYDEEDGGQGVGAAGPPPGGSSGGGDAGGGSGGWHPWQIGVLAAGLAAVVGLAGAGVLVFKARSSGGSKGRDGKRQRRGDLEAGRGGSGRPAPGGAGGAAAATAGAQVEGGGGSARAAAERRPLYDSFDDPAFELGFLKASKPSPDDVEEILRRINKEAAEFHIEMTEICGSGSFGVVYGGLWNGLKVAVKTMVFSESSPLVMAGQAARQQCIKEAAFCCTMHHVNVVATHHFYLKSANRTTMLDELLQLASSESDDAPEEDEEEAAGEGEGGNKKQGGVGVRKRNRRFRSFPLVPRVRPNVTDWRLYLIQEYCDGGTLRQVVDEGKMFKHACAERAGRTSAYNANANKHLPDAAAALSAVSAVSASTPTLLGLMAAADGRAAPALHAVPPPPKPQQSMQPALKGTAATTIGAAALHSGSPRVDRVSLSAAVTAAKLANSAADAATDAAEEEEEDNGSICSAEGTDADAAVSLDLAAEAEAGHPIDRLLSYMEHTQGVALLTPGSPHAGSGAGAGGGARVPRLALHQHRMHGSVNLEESTVLGTTTTNVSGSNYLGTTLDTLDSNIAAVGVSVADIGGTSPPAPAAAAFYPVAVLDAADDAVLPASLSRSPAPASRSPLPPTPLLSAKAAATATVTAATTSTPRAAARPRTEPHEDAACPLPADLSLVVQTALGIASGVAYLHSRNIIHGDLSANNVLLTRTRLPQLPVVAKISDFGLSLRLAEGQEHFKNVHHGTPYYQSPEVMEQGTCSLAADVYSVGVLLWELYHGPPPWRMRRAKPAPKPQPAKASSQELRAVPTAGAAKAAATAAVAAGGWDDPHYCLRACDVLHVAPHCPERYARLVRRCLSVDPNLRPSARSVVKTLLRMERGMAAAQAQATSGAMASASSLMAGPPMGAVMALSRPRAGARRPAGSGAKGGGGSPLDAALLLEDFDAAAAAVAAAVAAVTARPATAGAAACAGATARALAEGDNDALLAVGLEPGSVRGAQSQRPPVRTPAMSLVLSQTETEDATALAAAAAAAVAVCATEKPLPPRQASESAAAMAAAVAAATATVTTAVSPTRAACAAPTGNEAPFDVMTLE